MLDFAGLSVAEREPFFAETAARRSITKLIVEKDFWVCLVLHVLFSTPSLRGKLVFKGGTSLSKVFGVIKRFSEDIDLSVDPAWLGFGGENRPDSAPSRSKVQEKIKALNRACEEKVREVVLPVLEEATRAAIGDPTDEQPYYAFGLDPYTKSPFLTFHYPTNQQASMYLRPEVKLELGSLTDQEPTGEHPVVPWVAEEYPDSFAEPRGRVIVLGAERTFWEKVTILHAEYHRPAGKSTRMRLSRDYYDVYRLAEHPIGQRAAGDLKLLQRVVQHKRAYFRASWTSYDTAKPGTLKLVPPAGRLPELRTDYQDMAEMFIGPPPSFDEIIRRLRSLEAQINGESEGA